jgi:Reverse transcriptase (RNA-dependent DNA polymerase)
MLIIRDSFPAFCSMYLLFFNRIIQEGKIPVNWKSALITPVHKKGPKHLIENYRPVSGLCSLSKLFERCILGLMDCSSIEGEHQHGFRRNHSTVTAMLEVQRVLASELDNRKMVLMYSTDLSAAFDLLRPGILINSIKGKIPYLICRIIADFLSGRNYRVKLGNSVSSMYDLKVGCAQGSTLGPKLFAMYCGGLSDIVNYPLVAYADDVYVMIPGDNPEELVSKGNTMLKSHVEWLNSVGMVVNVSKTEAVVFCKRDVSITLEVNGISFNTTSHMKVLGVLFDSRLNWSKHTDNVITKAKKSLFGLRILRRNLGPKGFTKILTAQFFSKIYYGAAVWLPHLLSRDMNRIESVHYSALRIG